MISEPYTHAMHAARCREFALRGVVLSSQAVQVRRQGVIYCAHIREAWTAPTGLDCWTVDAFDPQVCRFTVPVRYVRLCADGCVCSLISAPKTLTESAARQGLRGTAAWASGA